MTSTIPFEWNAKTNERVSIGAPRLLERFGVVIWSFLGTSLWISVLLQYNYKPFESNVVLADYHFNMDLLQPGQVANNIIYACKWMLLSSSLLLLLCILDK